MPRTELGIQLWFQSASTQRVQVVVIGARKRKRTSTKNIRAVRLSWLASGLVAFIFKQDDALSNRTGGAATVCYALCELVSCHHLCARCQAAVAIRAWIRR